VEGKEIKDHSIRNVIETREKMRNACIRKKDKEDITALIKKIKITKLSSDANSPTSTIFRKRER